MVKRAAVLKAPGTNNDYESYHALKYAGAEPDIIHINELASGKAVLDGLKSLGPLKAVCGNMDSGELKSILPQKELFVVNGKKIGLTHGSGAPWGIAGRVRKMFDDVDIIIYGHSHKAEKELIRGSLLSFGLLTVDDEINAEIVRI